VDAEYAKKIRREITKKYRISIAKRRNTKRKTLN